jgi:F0F1-type ATP synthase assembly protein I
MLAGVVLGLAVGYGLDRLLGTSPAFLIVGVFVGFGLGLYAVFLETR